MKTLYGQINKPVLKFTESSEIFGDFSLIMLLLIGVETIEGDVLPFFLEAINSVNIDGLVVKSMSITSLISVI